MVKEVIGLPDNLDKKIMVTRKRPPGQVILKESEKPETEVEDLITNEENPVPIKNEKSVVIAIPTISLMNWFKKYRKILPDDIKPVKVGIAGIESDSYLFTTVPHPKGGQIKNGEPRREIVMFRNANKIPVLDLPISDISVYPSGFRFIHPFKNYFFKCYGGKPNCLTVAISANETLVPYYIVKIKNSSNAIIFKDCSIDYGRVLKAEATKASIQTLYPVITSVPDWNKMKFNIDFCNYFLSLQKDIRDNQHHIKLDNIMIGIITGHLPEKVKDTTHVDYQLIIERGK